MWFESRRSSISVSGGVKLRPATFLCVRPHTLGILGLGAIGGSVALQAKRAGIATVLGWCPDPAERAAAAQQGAIDDAPAPAADVARAAGPLGPPAPPPPPRGPPAAL